MSTYQTEKDTAGDRGSHARDLIHAAQQSFVDGWQQAMWAGVAVMGALLGYVDLLGYVAQRDPEGHRPVRPVWHVRKVGPPLPLKRQISYTYC